MSQIVQDFFSYFVMSALAKQFYEIARNHVSGVQILSSVRTATNNPYQHRNKSGYTGPLTYYYTANVFFQIYLITYLWEGRCFWGGINTALCIYWNVSYKFCYVSNSAALFRQQSFVNFDGGESWRLDKLKRWNFFSFYQSLWGPEKSSFYIFLTVLVIKIYSDLLGHKMISKCLMLFPLDSSSKPQHLDKMLQKRGYV